MQDDLADVRLRLASGSDQQAAAAAAPPPPPPLAVSRGNLIDVFGKVVPPISLDQVGGELGEAVVGGCGRWKVGHGINVAAAPLERCGTVA